MPHGCLGVSDGYFRIINLYFYYISMMSTICFKIVYLLLLYRIVWLVIVFNVRFTSFPEGSRIIPD